MDFDLSTYWGTIISAFTKLTLGGPRGSTGKARGRRYDLRAADTDVRPSVRRSPADGPTPTRCCSRGNAFLHSYSPTCPLLQHPAMFTVCVSLFSPFLLPLQRPSWTSGQVAPE
ncbi:hypothetical protein J6590_003756 [Homalodisca vitripennis]|nr:hypothetical protein J6590_003756 [Homalodisca vitripennis]